MVLDLLFWGGLILVVIFLIRILFGGKKDDDQWRDAARRAVERNQENED